jgi:hypothetical protein
MVLELPLNNMPIFPEDKIVVTLWANTDMNAYLQ